MAPKKEEREWLTRKARIDPRLDASGWKRPKAGTSPLRGAYRTEEHPTANGPADYALWVDRNMVGIVEAKRLTTNPQEVLTQAARYARGLSGGPFNYDGLRVPFLYSSNGELIWFRDVRNPLNLSRTIARFHTPSALAELLSRDFDAACQRLRDTPNDHPRLRPYQRKANAGIEQAIADRKRRLLVAMATGTGKTFTMVNQIYRLMKAGVAQRVLFLVDRRALAAQAVRAFSAFEAEPGAKFDTTYEVYSSRFQKDDLEEDDKFDPKVLPTSYLTDPKPGDAFVYVCTIQRMAMHVLGRKAVPELGEEAVDDDADRLDIPIHAFDLIVADECHRGYTAAEQSVWRDTLSHFDAIQIGLTATPAKHTAAYFDHIAARYDYDEAVRDGYLVDYDVVTVRSGARMDGIFLREGEQVELVDPVTGKARLDLLEDERDFDTQHIEIKVTSPDSNRKIVEEVKQYTLQHEERYGRFPKTLIFAVNDLPHTSHADQLVHRCRHAFGRGDDFVQKITGRVDRPLQRIREFRNRPQPGIAVTVDLLTTGVDIPDLEFLVFLRPVKSRILFDQMLGRGTRKGERFTDKSHFTVFDCFDGTLLSYFKKATDLASEPADLDRPTRALAEVIDDIWNNRDREYNTRCLVKRLHRVDKEMSAEGRDLFAAHIPDGDLGAFARELPARIRARFVETMKILRNPAFQDLLLNFPRQRALFTVAVEFQDTVTSEWLVRGADGKEYKPASYLAEFARYVRENPAHIQAITILLDRPRDWRPEALTELREKLAATPARFTLENLQRAHQLHYQRALVDIISMVKHAADEEQPLLTAAERVERAFVVVTAGRAFTPEQQRWLNRIRDHLRENLSIDEEDFGLVPIFAREGGLVAARRAFGRDLDGLLHHLNEAIAA